MHAIESSHAGDRTRAVRRDHAGVRDDDDVAVEPIPVLREQIREVGRPGLLFTLDQQLQVHGWARAPGGSQMGPHAQQMEQQLALVVGRAPRAKDVAVDGRIEWVRVPQFDRVDGLHVVVPVDHDGRRAAIITSPLGEHCR